MGYRSMTRCLRTRYNLNVSRNTVMKLLKELDPVGVEQRRARRLRRRVYRCPGPNVIWHNDGYDKRAPFGFGISGCIDGYSRRIMYVRVSSTNHDPSLIAGYYMACVEQLAAPEWFGLTVAWKMESEQHFIKCFTTIQTISKCTDIDMWHQPRIRG